MLWIVLVLVTILEGWICRGSTVDIPAGPACPWSGTIGRGEAGTDGPADKGPAAGAVAAAEAGSELEPLILLGNG